MSEFDCCRVCVLEARAIHPHVVPMKMATPWASKRIVRAISIQGTLTLSKSKLESKCKETVKMPGGPKRKSNKYQFQRATPRFRPLLLLSPASSLGREVSIAVWESQRLHCMNRTCQSQLKSAGSSLQDKEQSHQSERPYCLEGKANFRYQNHSSKNSICTFYL